MIGGLPKTGTNTIASFLHLHDDIFVFGVSNGARPKDLGSTYANKVIEKSNPIDFCEANNDEYKKSVFSIFKEKAKTKAESMERKYLAVREDFGVEFYKELKEKTVDVKLIMTMRKNIDDLYCSWRFVYFVNKLSVFNDPLGYFKGEIIRRMNFMEEIYRKYDGDIFFVDVTHHQNDKYTQMLNFLGLSLNQMQEKWVKNGIKTNQTGGAAEGQARFLFTQWKKGEKVFIKNKFQEIYNHSFYKRLYG